MSKFPSITARQFIKVLHKIGFQENRQKRSHLILVNPKTDQIVTVPIHQGKDLSKGLILGVLKDIKIDKDEFLKTL